MSYLWFDPIHSILIFARQRSRPRLHRSPDRKRHRGHRRGHRQLAAARTHHSFVLLCLFFVCGVGIVVVIIESNFCIPKTVVGILVVLDRGLSFVVGGPGDDSRFGGGPYRQRRRRRHHHHHRYVIDWDVVVLNNVYYYKVVCPFLLLL